QSARNGDRQRQPWPCVVGIVDVSRHQERPSSSASTDNRTRRSGASESRTRISYSFIDRSFSSARSLFSASCSHADPVRNARQARCSAADSHFGSLIFSPTLRPSRQTAAERTLP